MINHQGATAVIGTCIKEVQQAIVAHVVTKGSELQIMPDEEDGFMATGIGLHEDDRFDLEGGNEETVEAIFVKSNNPMILYDSDGYKYIHPIGYDHLHHLDALHILFLVETYVKP